MQFGRWTQSVFSPLTPALFSFQSQFCFVYVAWFGQQEAREKWQLMKLLPADVNLELLEAVFD